MNNRNLRKLVYEILEYKKTELYLFDFVNYVRNDADIDQIAELFEQYNKRYSNKLFQISNLGSLKKIYKMSTDLFIETQNLESGDFEKLSAKICEYFGFNREFYATKHSYDEGIDFIAYKEVDRVRFDFREFKCTPFFGQ